MKERPILFSGPMVRAILSGQKTVTRRFVPEWQLPGQTQGDDTEPSRWISVAQRHPRYGFGVFGSTEEECMANYTTDFKSCCPYGKPGDHLWVRETWYCDHFDVQKGPYKKPDDLDLVEAREDGTLVYAADGLTPYEAEQPIWKPSIHMPRWACRILLEITAVRVERLQDGEGETAFESRYIAEGIHRIHQGDGEYAFHPFKTEPGPGSWTDPFDAWRELWVSVNGADSWNANPWVWVVEFKRVMP